MVDIQTGFKQLDAEVGKVAKNVISLNVAIMKLSDKIADNEKRVDELCLKLGNGKVVLGTKLDAKDLS